MNYLAAAGVNHRLTLFTEFSSRGVRTPHVIHLNAKQRLRSLVSQPTETERVALVAEEAQKWARAIRSFALPVHRMEEDARCATPSSKPTH